MKKLVSSTKKTLNHQREDLVYNWTKCKEQISKRKKKYSDL